MILPNSRAYSALQKRLKDVASLYKNLPITEEVENIKDNLINHEELKTCFLSINLPQHQRFRNSLKGQKLTNNLSGLSEESKSISLMNYKT